MIEYIKVIAITGLAFFVALILVSYLISQQEINSELLKTSAFKSLAFALIFGSFRYFKKKKQG